MGYPQFADPRLPEGPAGAPVGRDIDYAGGTFRVGVIPGILGGKYGLGFYLEGFEVPSIKCDFTQTTSQYIKKQNE